ncbi:DUF6602 domain-containing protein [Alcanivorax sediminis]|uniref:DUF6602 domain-containing protein n=1 Tax=Alcanivorax sediminis TaxID=2663008 RepID=A0A6N7LZG6_9GAMM|nr:DUF6602 domain-containing protein [Alcanivorax sediminis]MQX53470.1 hypothetical protein [Alcanivorax sediminis]
MKQQGTNAIAILLDEKINEFKTAFIENSRLLFVDDEGSLVHPGEFGTYREDVVKKFLTNILPERMGMESGFVVTSNGKISTQCDIVIYDKSVTPLIKNENGQRFFPIESVVAIGEIKSKLSTSELKKALRKLAKTKSLRDYLYEPSYTYCKKEEGNASIYQPEKDELDQIITFLICEEFSFSPRENLVNIMDCYKEELPHRPFCHRHNMVLSINDGLLTYLHPQGFVYPFPSKATLIHDYGGTDQLKETRLTAELMKYRFIAPPTGSSEHIRHFTSMLHMALISVSVLYPEMARYIEGREDVQFIDFEQSLR